MVTLSWLQFAPHPQYPQLFPTQQEQQQRYLECLLKLLLLLYLNINTYVILLTKKKIQCLQDWSSFEVECFSALKLGWSHTQEVCLIVLFDYNNNKKECKLQENLSQGVVAFAVDEGSVVGDALDDAGKKLFVYMFEQETSLSCLLVRIQKKFDAALFCFAWPFEDFGVYWLLIFDQCCFFSFLSCWRLFSSFFLSIEVPEQFKSLF